MSMSTQKLMEVAAWEGNGIRIVGTPLWLDSTEGRELAVISHAHRDHVADHSRTLATTETLSLLGMANKPGAMPCSYRRSVTLGEMRLELLPSGHIYGGAQVLLEWKGTRILYTGDIYDGRQRFSEPLVMTTCDLLIIEATYGTPAHRFPSREEAAEELKGEVETALEEGKVPLVLVEGSLGRAQEICTELVESGFRVFGSKSIARWNRALQQCGVPVADVMPTRGRPPRGAVMVYPMRSRGLAGLNRLKNLYKIACSGQVGRSVARRLGVDVVVPFVDHADFDGLIRVAEACRPRAIMTVFGHPETLASALRDRGYEAQTLPEASQLWLEL